MGGSVKKYGAVMAAIVLLGAALLFPRFYQTAGTQSTDAVISARDCDLLAGACIASRDGLEIKLAVDAAVLASYQPVAFSVAVTGMKADAVSIDFEGVDMFMGINQLELTPAGNGGFVGTLALPGHAHAMTWRARVQLRQVGTRVDAEFVFDLK